MEPFVRKIVKTSLVLACLVAVVMIAVGVVLLLRPKIIFSAAAWCFLLGGILLCCRVVWAMFDSVLSK